jgi:NAD(P)-dependent dehydrogenase (short-subunit alcohol dehydrogenase family)
MPNEFLSAKRILVTQADAFMGPMVCEVFAGHGALVIADTRPLVDPAAPAAVVDAAGGVDILVANLAVPAPTAWQPKHRMTSGGTPSPRSWTRSPGSAAPSCRK